MSTLFSDHSKFEDGRLAPCPLATASRLWSFGSTGVSSSLTAADFSALEDYRTGMNWWKVDARKSVETPETGGGKADSADSLFGTTLSKKSRTDFKFRACQVPTTLFKAEHFPTSSLAQSMSQNNEAGSPLDLQQERDQKRHANAVSGESLLPESHAFGALQKSEPEEPVMQEHMFDMHHIRETVLQQEAVFREQVRELHRVHKVQILLMAEMRKRDSDLILYPSGTSMAGPSQSPAFSMSSGRWTCAIGQALSTAVNDYEGSIALPETFKGGSTYRQGDYAVSRPKEANLFKQSERVLPVRRKFDLERPPNDDDDGDDDQLEHKDSDSLKLEGNRMRFIESPESCINEAEKNISLNLSTGWDGIKILKHDREHVNKVECNKSRILKRPREEAVLFPFLSSKSESLRDAPLRPTPTMASQSFLGGLWGLQLGRKLDSSSTPDRKTSPEESEARQKKERLSLNLEVDKEVSAITPNGAPHWLLKAPVAKPPKTAVCQTEGLGPTLQDFFPPPKKSSEQEIMKSLPQSNGESGSGSTPGILRNAEGHVSDNSPKNPSQPSCNASETAEDNMQRASGVYQAPVVDVDQTASELVGYGPHKLAEAWEEAPGDEAVTLYTSWREFGDAHSNSFSHVFTQSHRLGGEFGVQLGSFDRHLGLAAQGFIQSGPTVNIATGAPSFVPDSGAGIWFQQTNTDPHYQQYHRQHQLGPGQMGLVSSTIQGPWQAAVHIPQGERYGQRTVFAVPTAAGPPLGFPLYGVQKVGDDPPGSNWTSRSAVPPFTPFSIVVPPKPPFKRPPKLVLTHDGTNMELKLVSPQERGIGAKSVTEKSFSGSSDEEFGDKGQRGCHVVLNKGHVGNKKNVFVQSKGRRERDKRGNNTGTVKDTSTAVSGEASDWTAKVVLAAAHKSSQAVRTGLQNASAAAAPLALQEGMDDADGGSSDAGSGGSGVGDVINPGDWASPSVGTSVHGGSNRNLPAGEGEEGIHMGELGLQADSESQSGRFDREDKLCENQEQTQEQFTSLSFRSSLLMIARKICRESSGAPVHVVGNTQKSLGGTNGMIEEGVTRTPGFHHVLELSGSSSGAMKNLLIKESQSHDLCPKQNFGELRSAQLDLQLPAMSTSQSRMVHTLKLEDPVNQGKESRLSGHDSNICKEQYDGRVARDIDDTEGGKSKVGQRSSSFSNFGVVSKQERESNVGHSKQLSGAKTSEKDGVQYGPFSPVLRQVSSPSLTVDMERHTGGSSKKVSQASETDQGNGRSPQRTSEWIGSTTLGQDHFCSSGGIDSSCEEVDGTLTSCNDSSITWSELEEEVQRTW